MEKKVSIVTGASSGLGKSLALLLCQKGHIVYVIARRRKLLNKLRDDCKNLPGQIIPVSGDLTVQDFRERLIKRVIKEQGKIDYHINNAGFGRSTIFEKESIGEMQKMVNLNLVTCMHLAKLALEQMKIQGHGRIINVGSVVAFTPLPYFTVYNATKAAVYAFNRSLRYELKGLPITSTVVLPARMKTGFANVAYDCYERNGQIVCSNDFNKIAGNPMVVARKIVRNMDKGKEVITPTPKARLWYTMRYFGFVVDFVMKNILGPKELKRFKKESEESNQPVLKPS